MSSIIPPFSSEIVSQIVLYLQEDIATLYQLCLVSRSIYGYVTPMLYRTYIREFGYPTKTDVFLFLRTVLIRPDLAEHVQRVVLHGWKGVKNEPDDPVVENPDNDIKSEGDEYDKDEESELKNFIDEEPGTVDYRKLCRSYVGWISYHWKQKVDPEKKVQQKWLKAVLDKDDDAMIALLLALLPNLQQLSFPEVHRPLYVKHIIAAAGDIYQRSRTGYRDARFTQTWRGLHHLHFVRTYSQDGKYGYLGMSDLDPLYRLESMRYLEVVRANMEGVPENSEGLSFSHFCPSVWEMSAGESPITVLSLLDSAISQSCIRQFLQPFSALKEFYYTYGRIHMYDTHFQPKDLRSALDHLKDSLELLCIDFDDYWDKWGSESYENCFFDRPGLNMFSALRVLSCSQQALTGLLHAVPEDVFYGSPKDILLAPPVDLDAPRLFESLPQSLQKLRIAYCDARILDQVQELAEMMKDDNTLFPKLQHVHLFFAEGSTKVEQVSMEELNETSAFTIEVAFGTHASEGDEEAGRWWFEGRDSVLGGGTARV